MVRADVERFELADARLAYLDLGDPGGRPVVALSGLSDGLAPVTDPRSREALPELPESLRRFRFVIVSYRDELPPSPSTRDLAADVAALIRSSFSGPVAVTGHSMGGMVAQHLAADHPGLVDRMLLSATAARAGHSLRSVVDRWERLVTDHRWRDFYRDAIVTSFTGSEQFRRRLLLRFGPAPAAPERVERHRALSDACRKHDATARLDDIRCPVLVLGADRDPIIPLAECRRLAEAIPQARLEVFEGVAHGFPEQVWRRYVRELVGFLSAERTDA